MIDVPYYLVTPTQSDELKLLDGFNIDGKVYGTYFGVLYHKQTIDDSSYLSNVQSFNPQIVNIPTDPSGSL